MAAAMGVALLLVSALTAQAQTAFQITGRVLDHIGEPRTGARVCAARIDVPPPAGAQCATSGMNGSFAIQPRGGAGRYRLSADDFANGHVSQTRPFYRAPTLPVVEITLEDTSPTVNVDVRLAPRNGQLVISAVDEESGWPIDPLTVWLCHAAEPGTCLGGDEHPDNGRVTLFAPHVPFTLRLSSGHHLPWPDLRSPDPIPALTVSTGERREITVRLQRNAQSIGRPLDDQEKTRGIYLPAPDLVSPPDGALLNAFPRQTRLEWRAVDGASSYRVEIDYCQGTRDVLGCVSPKPLKREDPPMSGITATTYEFPFVGAQPGRWRVVAVDREGREGFFSPWRVFVYNR